MSVADNQYSSLLAALYKARVHCFSVVSAKSVKMACILKAMPSRGIVTVNDIYDIVRAFIWYHED